MNRTTDAREPTARHLCALVAVLLGLAFSGCMPKSTPPGAAIVGGKVGRGGFTFLRWEQGLEIMIWHDLDSSSNHGSGSTRDPIYRLSGYASSSDGRRVDWQAQTMDGRTAQFWIDGVSYDLASGALFIVMTRDGATRIKQFYRELSAVQSDYDSCVDFARGDPDLARLIDGLIGVYSLTDLVDDLRALGLAVVATERPVDHGFAIEGVRILVGNTPVFVYEFEEATAAQTAASGVSTDAYSMTITRSEGRMTYEHHGDWEETPHVYLKGRVIVVTGDDPLVVDALDTLLGPPLASQSPR
jgi:hypothetical protein